jgi:hypothetical protein
LKAKLILLLCLTGCGVPTDPEVELGTTELIARHFVWRVRFGSKLSPPPVHWWYDTCPLYPDNPRAAVVTVDGKCYSGLFWSYEYRIDVAWRGSFSRSAYSHELMHAWQYTRGIDDPDHALEEWKEIPNIDAELLSKGL